MENEKLLEALELEIQLYASTHYNRIIDAFINRVVGYLRQNMELLQDDNYKKLYDECILVVKWLNRNYRFTQTNYEMVIDLMNTKTVYAYNKEIVDSYLEFRINSWKTGYYDKLFE